MDVNAAITWLQLLPRIIDAGQPAVNAIVKTLKDHGIEADTTALDAVIADADARRARAEREAEGGGV